MRANFWVDLSLGELTDEEWEALCDGCGRCCLNKLQDEDTGDVFYTSLACQKLDMESGGCGSYANRFNEVPACMNVQALFKSDPSLSSMPTSCAYRLRAAGKGLATWHPLRGGGTDDMDAAGISVSGRVLPEQFVHESDWENHIIDWIEL